MCPSSHRCRLGFANEQFEPGVHVCHIYSEDRERLNALLGFLLTGIQDGERTSCCSEHCEERFIVEELARHGLSYTDISAAGAVTLSGVKDVYFEAGGFDPEQMLDKLRQLYLQGIEGGYRAARIIGDMLPEVLDIAGLEPLLEYESRVTLLQRDYPITAVCQYDARAFNGADILEILKVHPLMVVQGAVIHNPFYIPPERYLRERHGAAAGASA
jgi:hypothetical protein